jgi:peptide/nickel transport system substrate-binding protein
LAPFASITTAMRKRRQLSADGDWLVDYPNASSYIPQFFSCRGGNSNGYYCDPRLDRAMRAASRVEIQNPARAAALCTAIDHQLTDAAAWMPTENLRDVELVSRRLRNYQYNPNWGFLADQAWLR